MTSKYPVVTDERLTLSCNCHPGICSISAGLRNLPTGPYNFLHRPHHIVVRTQYVAKYDGCLSVGWYKIGSYNLDVEMFRCTNMNSRLAHPTIMTLSQFGDPSNYALQETVFSYPVLWEHVP